MKTKSKFLTVAMAAALAALAGCGGGSDSGATASGPEAAGDAAKRAQAAGDTSHVVVVRAWGSLAANAGPVMKLRVNGSVVGSAEVRASSYQDYAFTVPAIVPGSTVDVVFDDDFGANGQDRNLFVESITLNGATIAATAQGVTLDRGAGAQAFDGQDVLPGQSALWWNAALRFTAPQPSGEPNVVVRAWGSLAGNVGPVMQLRVNGATVSSAEVRAGSYQNYSFTVPAIAVGDKVDLVFDNDLVSNGQDRNLFVESITVNGATVAAHAAGVAFDRGAGAQAFDGLDVLPGLSTLWWNGALRFSVAAAAAPTGATYYVDANAANDLGTGAAASPKKYLSSGAALLSSAGGDTLVVKPGTYGNNLDDIGGKGSGRDGAWNVIKAEVDGTVKITAPFYMPKGDHYVQLEGLVWNSNHGKGISGRYVKILRCGFVGGPLVGNAMVLAIGGGSRNELGAQHVLMEDSYAFGAGGRYKVLVYNADKVVLRRVVARQEVGWLSTEKAGEPSGGITIYNSTNVLTQNLLIADSTGTPNFYGALYHPTNGSDTVSTSANVRNVGTMVLNSDAGIVWTDGNTAVGMTLEDSVVVNSGSDGLTANGQGRKQVAMRRVSVVGAKEKGVSNYSNGTSASDYVISDSIVAKSGTVAFGGPVGVQNVTSVAPQWPVKPVGTNGATILKRLGKPGTLYGEAGYDAVQSEDLWPFPNEVAIKKAMCQNATPPVATGLCAKPSLTHYVWEALGTPKP